MIIQIDTREKPNQIVHIVQHFENCGIQYYRSKLFVADYMSVDNPRLLIDRKKNLSELCNNVYQDHKRFTDELDRANKFGYKIIILCEHGGGIKSLNDVRNWQNPRQKKSPLAVSGDRLHKTLCAMTVKYGFKIVFCNRSETGARIVELLNGSG